MSEDSEKTGARSAIILLVVVFLVAGFSVKFGLQTLTWIEAKLWASENPWLATVPQPLPAPTALAKGSVLKAFDYEFESPWPGNPKPVGSLTATQFRYDSGQVILFFDPASSVDTVGAMKTSNPVDYQKFVTVFADHPINSNYELYQAVYSASPAQLSPLMDTREALRMNALLLWKLSFGFDLPADGQFYSFDRGKVRGFQFGDPAKQRPVAVRVFDDRDRQYRFILTTAAGSTGKISQDDVDTIVQTVRPVPIEER
ncbi:MAG: hypothetical protein WCA15_10120 [Candidatus Acidiferrales bacterium]